ncbi:MAG TPA: DUF1501 domain-containing protein [Planctomycetota bacterium]|nr:DUF1501 domain-containing protein [Planctomycetota bacterium]
MLTIWGERRDCGSGIRRRGFLRVGALGFAGLALPDVLRARAATGGDTSDSAVILIFLGGGPSHLDTYDPKPEAPAEYRGPWRAISTNVPGIRISEILPRHARIADKFSIIRSCSHETTAHEGGKKRMLTGHLTLPGDEETRMDIPPISAVVSRQRGANRAGLPASVACPPGIYYAKAGYLGRGYDAFEFYSGNAPRDLALPREMTLERLEHRRSLLGSLDGLRRDIDSSHAMEGMDDCTARAFELVSGSAARDAFDLGREPAAIREKYGQDWVGKACLQARRLVEAGVTFVTLGWEGWDDHDGLKDKMSERSPTLDRAVPALIEDLYARGLDRKVTVMVLGEFGRTPKMSASGGRDHWPSAMSVLVSGGGMRMGQVIGSTDSKGETPLDRRVSPEDILATVYANLGIDPRAEFLNHAGRPIPILPGGVPIAELRG